MYDRAMFAVIFDFDGTIVDSESAEYLSHRQYFAEHGVELTEQEWCTGIGVVKGETHWWDWLCTRAAAPPPFRCFRDTTRAYFREHVRMEPMPGVAALVGALAAAGIPRAIASAAPSEWVLNALADLDLERLFGAIVTGDQVEHPKPAPDVYLEAARRLAVTPYRCVAIEDSGPGLAAAHAAGMRTVAIPHQLNRHTHDFGAADLHLTSARDLSVERLQQLLAD